MHQLGLAAASLTLVRNALGLLPAPVEMHRLSAVSSEGNGRGPGTRAGPVISTFFPIEDGPTLLGCHVISALPAFRRQ
jgi:hypothetical protein